MAQEEGGIQQGVTRPDVKRALLWFLAKWRCITQMAASLEREKKKHGATLMQVWAGMTLATEETNNLKAALTEL